MPNDKNSNKSPNISKKPQNNDKNNRINENSKEILVNENLKNNSNENTVKNSKNDNTLSYSKQQIIEFEKLTEQNFGSELRSQKVYKFAYYCSKCSMFLFILKFNYSTLARFS